MKKTITLLLSLFTLASYAQDTTSWRAIGMGVSDNIAFYFDDKTNMGTVSFPSFSGPCHGVFMNPNDSLLYALMSDWSNDRDLYKVNPFTGELTLAFNFATNYYSSIDLSEDGLTLYVINGNGGPVNGQLSRIPWGTTTATPIGVIQNDPGNSSYGIEFHPADSSIYVWEGSWNGPLSTYLHEFDLATGVIETNSLAGDLFDDQIHGAMFTGTDSVFLVISGQSCNYMISDITSYTMTEYLNSCSPYVNDISEMLTLRNAENIFCPGDSVLISLIYESTSFTWYKDGVALTETNDSLWALTAGTYQVLYHLDGNSHMWSEDIVITTYASPVVTISQTSNDVLICPGETIVLNGASGGSLQWYLNGSPISGANANNYGATVPGSYNQLKTNMSGCSDSSATPYVITLDPSCLSSISENSFNLTVYPNPVDNELTVLSDLPIQWVAIVDISGREVYRSNLSGNFSNVISFEKMNSGIYFLQVKTSMGIITKKIIK